MLNIDFGQETDCRVYQYFWQWSQEHTKLGAYDLEESIHYLGQRPIHFKITRHIESNEQSDVLRQSWVKIIEDLDSPSECGLRGPWRSLEHVQYFLLQ